MRLFDHANLRPVAMRIAAVGAQFGVADVVAFGAQAEMVFHVQQRGGEPLGVLAGSSEDVEGKTLGGFLADAGQAAEFVDEPLQGRGEIGHTYESRTGARAYSTGSETGALCPKAMRNIPGGMPAGNVTMT